MKKNAKRGTNKLTILLLIIIISFVCQTGMLYYVNNYYLASNKNLKYKQVTNNNIINKKDVKVDVNASKFQMSLSGNYCSYYSNNKFYVANLLNGTVNEVKVSGDILNYCFNWAATDRIIFSEKSTVNGRSGIKMYNYNPKTNEIIQAETMSNKKYLYNIPTADSKVTNIETHTLNTIMYLKFTTINNLNYISRLDISDISNPKQTLFTKKIGNYFAIKQSDEIIYEGSQDGKIYITDQNKSNQIKISDALNLKLLAVDTNDNVYIGEVKNKTITKIYKNNYGSKKNTSSTWQSYSLESPADIDNVRITYSGKMYVVDNLKGTVTDVQSNKTTSYNGIFEDINDNGVLSLNDNKLTITKCK